jgi:hypothetical protein
MLLHNQSPTIPVAASTQLTQQNLGSENLEGDIKKVVNSVRLQIDNIIRIIIFMEKVMTILGQYVFGARDSRREGRHKRKEIGAGNNYHATMEF